MYSKEQRERAVKLLIQYDMCYSTTIRELGYPNINSLRAWHREFVKKGCLHDKYDRRYKYSEEQKQQAVNYYLEHGRCISRTCKKLGYPSRPLLDLWIKELVPEKKKHCLSGGKRIKYTREQKINAVAGLCAKKSTAEDIAKELGVTRTSIYNWKQQLFGNEEIKPLKKQKKGVTDSLETQNNQLKTEISELSKEHERLLKENYRLQLENDVLAKAAEIIKKDQGINLKTLTNREKSMVIDALREKYSLKELLGVFNMAKSSYCYQKIAMRFDKYESVRIRVIEIFNESRRRYGYRRIHIILKNEGVEVSEKIVRRLMREEGLVVYQKRKKKYSSYQGEISPAVHNELKRDFHADKPNMKWLTAITEFGIPAGKVYLSPIIDCFDGLPTSWTIGTSPDAKLVNTMLDDAIATLNVNEHPIVHSDRGAHYRWPGWIERMDKAHLKRSMSKKGCSPDNSACEGFFGTIKNEMFYNETWNDVSVDEFIDILDEYLIWFREERIKISLNGMSPMNYRRSLGLAV